MRSDGNLDHLTAEEIHSLLSKHKIKRSFLRYWKNKVNGDRPLDKEIAESRSEKVWYESFVDIEKYLEEKKKLL